MWVFGYGSLTWAGWENRNGCRRRVLAELPGFRRTFNKASVKNWGTKDMPAPTLNLAADSSASCKGLAFEFPEAKRGEVLAFLEKREGKGFELGEHEIRLESGDRVKAVVPIYCGKSLLKGKSVLELAAMARLAVGADGRCIDYVRNVAAKLAELGIYDPAVEEFRRALDEAPPSRARAGI